LRVVAPAAPTDLLNEGAVRFIPADRVIVGRGATVAFATEATGVDVAAFGTVTDRAPVDPEGFVHDDVVEVTWEDGEIEFVGRADLVLVVK
jgi:hypothetical protein